MAKLIINFFEFHLFLACATNHQGVRAIVRMKLGTTFSFGMFANQFGIGAFNFMLFDIVDFVNFETTMLVKSAFEVHVLDFVSQLVIDFRVYVLVLGILTASSRI